MYSRYSRPFQEILNNEDCEELDPGSGSVHSAGNLTQNQHQQRTSSSNRIQSSARSGQKLVSGMSITGHEKILPPNSLNLTSTISK